jgi:uncharacterized protein
LSRIGSNQIAKFLAEKWMLKRIFWAVFFVLALTLFAPASWAIPLDAVPDPRIGGSWVTDMANLLSPATEDQLNQMITQFNAEDDRRLLVVTVPETPDNITSRQFAVDLFDRLNLDDSANHFGVLFLISQHDRQVEIRTGIRSTVLLPNDRVRQIIYQRITPQFKQDRFDRGTLAGTQALIKALTPSNSNLTLPIALLTTALVSVIGFAVTLKGVNTAIDPTRGMSEEAANRYRDALSRSQVYISGSGSGGGGSSGGGGGSCGGGGGGSW